MSKYFPDSVKLELDLVFHETKNDVKQVTVVDSSKFAKTVVVVLLMYEKS